jgi:nickel-dependent lactate racemase
LDNAKHAVRDEGIIILAASCKEGLGERVFEKWINDAEKPDDLVERIKVKFELGGHKAAAIGMVMQNAKVFLVSDLEPDFVKKLFMVPFAGIQEAIDEALKEHGGEAKILVMPNGGSTLPVIE